MKIAMVITDGRDESGDYSSSAPLLGTAVEALLKGLAEIPGVEVHLLSCARRGAPRAHQLAQNIQFHPVQVPRWAYMRSLYFGAVLALRRKLRTLEPDIVHGQGTERACALAAVFSGFPNVVTVHGLMGAVARQLGAPVLSFHRLAAQLEAVALRRADCVFCNSTYTEETVARVSRRTCRMPNALRPEFFSVPASAPIPNRVPRLLNVGHVVPYKRQVELLDAASRWHAAGPPFSMEFIGDVSASHYGDAFQAKLAKAPFARWHGSVALGGLLGELDSADGIIHVPVEESFGLAAAEGLARNLKLFASRTGGIIDIADGVEGAETFAREDWDGLGRAIAEWLRNGAPHPAGAASVMRSRYHPSHVAAAHVAAYRRLVDAARAARKNS